MTKKELLSIARDLIAEVIINNSVFSLAMKTTFKKYNFFNDDKNIISALAGCELRHHLIFQEITKRYFGELTPNNAITVYLALANILFVKKIDEEETINFVIETFENNNADFSSEDIINFFEKSKKTQELIPNEYQKNSSDFLSLRFNTPKWLIKMWKKTFGEAITYKIIKANSKPPLNSCVVNKFISDMGEIISNPELFIKGFVDGTVIYLGKSPIKKQNFVLQNKIYPQKLSLKHALDGVEFDPFKGVAVFQGSVSNTYLEAITHTNPSVDLDVIVSTYQDYHEIKTKIKELNLEKTHLYKCEPSSILTCISRPVHTFIVSPKSSNFDLLKSAPDYFLHFKPETLESLIENQYLALCECSNFVEENGQLVYVIPTISNKEGHLNIEKFIKDHPDFVLESERQYFPFDPYDSSMYFALLRKVKQEND